MRKHVAREEEAAKASWLCLNRALLEAVERIAKEKYDGHYTILKFTTGYKVIFGTLDMTTEDREYVGRKKTRPTIDEALQQAVEGES